MSQLHGQANMFKYLKKYCSTTRLLLFVINVGCLKCSTAFATDAAVCNENALV